MKTKLIALLCLCAVMLFALTENADIAEPQNAQEKMRNPNAVDPYIAKSHIISPLVALMQ